MSDALTVGSLFSGIGGFDIGFEQAGWRVIWQVENHPFRKKILKRHWPDVELRDDIRTDTDGLARPDLICGGFPCQDLSVAGTRAGLAGERSSLWFEYLRVVRETRPTWVVIENVPGLLSSQQGKDMEIVVKGLAECGYGVAWRVLDSQFFGVAQRRRRLYIVGYLGGPCPLEVLFEPESGDGPNPAGGKTGQDVANTLSGGSSLRGWADDPDRGGAFIPQIAGTLAQGGDRDHRPTSVGHGAYIVAPTLNASGAGTSRPGGPGLASEEQYLVVGAETDADGVREATGVPGRMDTPDGPRYAALGDAVSVPVAEWIAGRIRDYAQDGPLDSRIERS